MLWTVLLLPFICVTGTGTDGTAEARTDEREREAGAGAGAERGETPAHVVAPGDGLLSVLRLSRNAKVRYRYLRLFAQIACIVSVRVVAFVSLLYLLRDTLVPLVGVNLCLTPRG